MNTKEERFSVFVRCRPQSDAERKWASTSAFPSRTSPSPLTPRALPAQHAHRYSDDIVRGTSDGQVICYDHHVQRSTSFVYGGFFGPTASNEEIYSRVSNLGLVDSLYDGINATVFVYGATGTGKTHTMMGKQPIERGLFHSIVDSALSRGGVASADIRLTVSFFEIYLEKVYDLISASATGSVVQAAQSGDAAVKEDSQGMFSVPGVSRIEIKTSAQFESLLQLGHRMRIVRSTKDNLLSSRSHAVLQVTVEQLSKNIRGTLMLVDLAGSERSSVDEEANVVRQSERAKINTSLLALGNAIDALSKNAYVNYRNSVLTKLLKQSLEGHARVAMIACVSPSAMCLQETVSTLYYANRAQSIKTQAKRNFLASPSWPFPGSAGSAINFDDVTAILEGRLVEGHVLEASLVSRDGRPYSFAGTTEWSVVDDSGAIVDALPQHRNTWSLLLRNSYVGQRIAFQFFFQQFCVKAVTDLPILFCDPAVTGVSLVGKPIEGDCLCAVYSYLGGSEGDTLFEWSLSTNGKLVSSVRALLIKPEYVGSRLQCRITPVRCDGAKGSPCVIVSDVVIQSAPRFTGLRFVFHDNRLIMQGDYHGGIEGSSTVVWQRSLRLPNFRPIENAMKKDYFPSVDDFESYLRVSVLPTRIDGVVGEWQFSAAQRLRIDDAFWAAVTQRISTFQASFNVVISDNCVDRMIVGTEGWQFENAQLSGNFCHHRYRIVLDHATPNRASIVKEGDGSPVYFVAETSRMRDLIAITFRVFDILSTVDSAERFIGVVGWQKWMSRAPDAMRTMKASGESLIPVWISEHDADEEIEDEKRLVNALWCILVEHNR